MDAGQHPFHIGDVLLLLPPLLLCLQVCVEGPKEKLDTTAVSQVSCSSSTFMYDMT
jgi:hypothetical protein